MYEVIVIQFEEENEEEYGTEIVSSEEFDEFEDARQWAHEITKDYENLLSVEIHENGELIADIF